MHYVCLYNIVEHVIKFGNLGRFLKKFQSSLNLIWLFTVWIIWKERNSQIFQIKQVSIMQFVDKVKLLTFSWLKAKITVLSFDLHLRWHSPIICMGFVR